MLILLDDRVTAGAGEEDGAEEELKGVEVPPDEFLIFAGRFFEKRNTMTTMKMIRARMITLAKDMDFIPIRVSQTLAYLD